MDYNQSETSPRQTSTRAGLTAKARESREKGKDNREKDCIRRQIFSLPFDLLSFPCFIAPSR